MGSDFIFRKALPKDLEEMLQLLKTVNAGISEPDWFVAAEDDFIRDCIGRSGFSIVAQIPGATADPGTPHASSDRKLAGFFSVHFPGLTKHNMGHYLNFPSEKLIQAAHMDTAVVASPFRGHHLQARMLDEAEKVLSTLPYHYLLVTVHPDNRYSLNNMLSRGYEIQDTRLMYGGVLRHILMKTI